MNFITDNRGVSEVVGAILVFGVLIALLAILQTQAIPAANQQVEFDHNQEVQGDLIKFHQTVDEVATTGEKQSVGIKTGTGYPSRLLFYSPPSATGQLSTTENRTVTITNASATEPEVNDYMNGSNTLLLPSRNLRYSVNYNYLDDAPTTRYEYGILYNNFSDATIIENPGSVIDDTDINLNFMAGNYSDSGGLTQSVDVRAVSSPARPVTIEGENDDNITLELPTQLSLSKWEQIVGSQSTVLNVSKPTNDTVRIDLDGSERYTLRMSRLGLEPGVEKPEPHYIVPAEDGVTTVGAGQNATVKYEVRDKYNNPVSGVDVTIEPPTGSSVTKTTDGRGRVSLGVTPDSRVSVTAEVDSSVCSAGPRCQANYLVQVSSLNPNPSAGVRLTDATNSEFDAPLLDFTLAGDQLAFTLESDENTSIQRFRINHYHKDPNAHSPVDLSDGDGGNAEVTGIVIGGDYVGSGDGVDNLNKIVKDEQNSFVLTFDEAVTSDHYAVLTIVYENNERSLYFVSASS
ncbi:Ig-like domain-containing protein [Natronomonas gomsonensis]|uniref:Ig-like domain-containing protein n=1 Tax=Natronomonas gomsonensis TaxID=1046043 RepID=UPI0020CA34A2|nr:Ig-like domain-containing protein [Natronomonas gomsonensis]MCY4732392.1 Ig-like domain-containing protein [Natronomonas gomsonensis]